MIALTASTMNDADVLEGFLRFHLEQGVDRIVLTDVSSDDGTADILQSFSQLDEVVWLTTDPEQNREASDRRNRMKNYCEEHLSATWIICSDVDEFWWPGETTLKEALPRHGKSGVDVLMCRRFNMVASGNGRNLLSAPFDFMDFEYSIRAPEYPSHEEIVTGALRHPWVFYGIGPKVAIRGGRAHSIQNGAHAVSGPDLKVETPADIDILHFPLRSYAQFRNKVDRIHGFMEANNLQSYDAWHWQRWARMLDTELEQDYLENTLSAETMLSGQQSGQLFSEEGFRSFATLRLN